MSAEKSSEEPAVPDAVLDEIIKAFYPSVIRSGEAVRQRAQGAYGIASAIAAGLVAAGVFGDFDNRPNWLKALGFAALGFWLIAAWMYLRTVAGSTGLYYFVPREEEATADRFASTVLGAAQQRGEELERRLRWALVATALALALTFAAVIAAFSSPTQEKTRSASLVLSKIGESSLARMCNKHLPSPLPVRLRPSQVSQDVVTIRIAPGVCQEDAQTAQLRAATILAVEIDNPTR